MYNKPRNTKKVYNHKQKKSIAHVQARAVERFGVELTEEEVTEIIKMIQRGEGKFIGAQSLSKTHHLITYKGKEMVVVYDKIRKVPRTILAKEMEYNYESDEDTEAA